MPRRCRARRAAAGRWQAFPRCHRRSTSGRRESRPGGSSFGAAGGGNRDASQWNGIMRRIVSLWLPLFPVEQLMRARQKAGEPLPPPEAPFALVTAEAKGMRLAAINRVAQRLGLMQGDRLADARARVPHLLSEVHDTTRDEAALPALARWAERWSPSSLVGR